MWCLDLGLLSQMAYDLNFDPLNGGLALLAGPLPGTDESVNLSGGASVVFPELQLPKALGTFFRNANLDPLKRKIWARFSFKSL